MVDENKPVNPDAPEVHPALGKAHSEITTSKDIPALTETDLKPPASSLLFTPSDAAKDTDSKLVRLRETPARILDTILHRPEKHRPEGMPESIQGSFVNRTAVKFVSRAVVGCLAYALTEKVVGDALQGYDKSTAFDGNNHGGKDGAIYKGLYKVAQFLDGDNPLATVASLGANKMSWLDGDGVMAKARKTPGSNQVARTAGFLVMGAADNLTRSTIWAVMDPAESLKYQKDPEKGWSPTNIDYDRVAKSVVHKLIRVAGRDSFEDIPASAGPYVLSRETVARVWPEYSQSTRNGASRGSDQTYKTTRLVHYATDIQAGFYIYNVVTKMWRDTYDKIEGAVSSQLADYAKRENAPAVFQKPAAWLDSMFSETGLEKHFGKPEPKTTPEPDATVEKPQSLAGKAMDSVGNLAKYVTTTMVKVGIYMHPAIPFFSVPRYYGTELNDAETESRPLGKLIRSQAHRFGAQLKEFDSTHPIAVHFGKLGIQVDNQDMQRIGKDWVEAASAYFPYMHAKAEFARLVDTPQMDALLSEVYDESLNRIKSGFATVTTSIGNIFGKNQSPKLAEQPKPITPREQETVRPASAEHSGNTIWQDTLSSGSAPENELAANLAAVFERHRDAKGNTKTLN